MQHLFRFHNPPLLLLLFLSPTCLQDSALWGSDEDGKDMQDCCGNRKKMKDLKLHFSHCDASDCSTSWEQHFTSLSFDRSALIPNHWNKLSHQCFTFTDLWHLLCSHKYVFHDYFYHLMLICTVSNTPSPAVKPQRIDWRVGVCGIQDTKLLKKHFFFTLNGLLLIVKVKCCDVDK